MDRTIEKSRHTWKGKKQVVTSRGWGGGAIEGEGSEGYRLWGMIYTTRIYCKTQGIEPIFYNNYHWNITFKNCESLYCIPVPYAILYNYSSIFKKRKKKDGVPLWLSGLRIRCCHCCSSVTAVTQVWSLALELLHTMHGAKNFNFLKI